MSRPGNDAGIADLRPAKPIERLTGPVGRFLRVEAAGGAVLLAFAAAGLVLANSPLSEAFLGLWTTKVAFSFGGFALDHSLRHWINDGLMGIFFFVVGLEVKREIALGELRDPRRAALPVAAALGGMVVPALVYLGLQAGEPTARGWGIPMATDIAFVVGCMALLGPRVPRSLRVMLLSLAIVDDIGAILVIAIGYTESLDGTALALAGAGIATVIALGRLGVQSVGVYVLVGGGVWLAFHESGVHATIAGVILGILTPARSRLGKGTVRTAFGRATDFLRGESGEEESGEEESGEEEAPHALLHQVSKTAREGVAPLERLLHGLHPYTAFAIMPLFALANAGVPIELDGIRDPVAVAIAAGLVLGKPLGVVGVSALAVALGLARLPEGVSWGAIAGGGLLAGIGFTMSIFIAGLALDGPDLDAAKLGILLGSAVAAVAGMTVLLLVLPRR